MAVPKTLAEIVCISGRVSFLAEGAKHARDSRLGPLRSLSRGPGGKVDPRPQELPLKRRVTVPGRSNSAHLEVPGTRDRSGKGAGCNRGLSPGDETTSVWSHLESKSMHLGFITGGCAALGCLGPGPLPRTLEPRG